MPEVRFVGDTVYTRLPANHVRRPPEMPERARWVASERDSPKGVDISELAEFGDRALAHPQQALDWVRRPARSASGARPPVPAGPAAAMAWN
jgi:hypothetical protein